ncbi:MAG: hypothetical protein H3Z52_06985 [archaeon]|nr:hypothetical protein [archaeon]MCP8320668.1 hypothetical protein [archaeon]
MGEEKFEGYEKAKSQTALLEKIMLFIPGFRGYKEKEIRRESDKLLRDKIYKVLVETKDDLKETYRRLVEARVTEVWDDTDRLIAKFDRISERINHAEYGYAGFFNVVKVREPDLDRMIKFDLSLLERVEGIKKSVSELKEDTLADKFDKARVRTLELHKSVDSFEKIYNQRKEVILGV